MLNMRSVVKAVQIAQQAKPPNRAPAHEFDEAVAGIGVRGNQHFPTGVLAVVEGQEKRAPFVPVLLTVAAQRKSAPLQLYYSHKNPEQIPQRAKRFECSIGERGDVRREANAQ